MPLTRALSKYPLPRPFCTTEARTPWAKPNIQNLAPPGRTQTVTTEKTMPHCRQLPAGVRGRGANQASPKPWQASFCTQRSVVLWQASAAKLKRLLWPRLPGIPYEY